MKKKKHYLRVAVTFDKPVTPAVAARAMNNHIGGDDLFSCIMEEEQDGWGKVRLGRITQLPEAK